MNIRRRTFLKNSSIAAAGTLLLPQFLHAFGQRQGMPNSSGKILVVLQLSGGNDGLNTIIPIRNDIYYKQRPRLAIERNTALTLTDEVGLNPALSAFKRFFDDGELAILNGVGYPNPDRSHFRSMDIWHSASQSNQYVYTGWLGRYLDAMCSGCDHPTQAVEVDDVLSLALKGERQKGLAFTEVQRMVDVSKNGWFRQLASIQHPEEPMAAYLYKTLADTMSSADYLAKEVRKPQSTPNYPNTELGKNLKTIAGLIMSEVDTRVYYLSHGSFDTHVNQQPQQTRLFTEMNDAVAAFTKHLKQENRFKDVLLLTFSEFGRRVAQNASGGTDHGTANNMMFVGENLRQQGLLNPLPNLADLEAGDLKYSVDFKNVYATVLDKWLSAPADDILGATYQRLTFI
jgi:uncharacterized protein (DUF1501 family)